MSFRSTALRLSQALSLRVAIAAPIALLLLLFALSLTQLHYRRSQATVRDLAAQLQNEASRHAVQQVGDRLAVSRNLALSNATAIDLGVVDPENKALTGQYFWQQLQNFNVRALNFTSLDGLRLVVRRQRDGTARLFFSNNPDSQWRSLKLAQEGTIAQVPTPSQPPQYLSPISAGPSSPYWQLTPSGGLAANVPIFRDGEFSSLLSVETNLAEIGQFLRRLQLGSNGQAFILNRQGQLLATSGTDTLFANPDGTSTPATDSRDPIIQAVANVLQQRFSGLQDIEDTQILNFSRKTRRYFLQVTPLRDDWGLDWLLVVAVPESDFTAPLRQTLYYTLALSAIALLVSLFVSWQLARWLTRPIRRLTKSVARLGQQRWQAPVVVERSQELGHLARTFNRAAMQLQTHMANLEADNAALQATDRLKDLYLHSLAEEFRKPQTEAIALVRELLDRPDAYPEDDRQRLERIAKLGKRLLELMQDISDLTKIHSGQLQAHLKPVDVQDLIDRIVAQHRRDLDLAGLELHRRDFPPPLYVRADPQMLEQVLTIILENAIQFTESGSITVSTAISAPMGKTSYHELPEAIVTVSDTGIGIDPDQQDKLFRPFAKIEGCPEHRRGPGLGLAIAGSLVGLMGGQIAIDSDGCDRGTTVKIVLPVLSELATA